MKKQVMKNLKVATLGLICSLAVIGCNNNSKNSTMRVAGAAASSIPQSTSGNQVLANIVASSDPTTLVQSMFSAAGVSNVGTIDMNSGMAFFGTLHFTNNGSGSYTFTPTTSYLTLQFKDSYYTSGQSGLLEYQIGMNSSSQATLTSNGSAWTLQAIFRSSSQNVPAIGLVGTFTMVGSTPQIMSGTVSVDLNNTNSWTALGTFQMQTCGILVCN